LPRKSTFYSVYTKLFTGPKYVALNPIKEKELVVIEKALS